MVSQQTKEELLPLLKNALARERAQRHDPTMRVQVGSAIYDEEEVWGALSALLDDRISQGPRVAEFEKAFAAYIGVKHAVALNSGSSANLVALNALMYAGNLKAGDEVIMPSATFCTVASPAIQLGLIPVYIDVRRDTFNIDPARIEAAIGPRTRAIMPVHSLGNPADMDAILAIARKHNLVVLEDCCEAHGSRLGRRMAGSMGDIGTYSFFVAHNMTTGEGGMIMTNDDRLAELCRSLREFGRIDQSIGRFDFNNGKLKNYDKRYVFQRLGYNLRMTDMIAGFGLAQLKRLDAMNNTRREIVADYNAFFGRYDFFQTPVEQPGGHHTYYGYMFVLNEHAPFQRREFVEYLEKENIETRPFFAGCLPDQPGFMDAPHRIGGTLEQSRYLRDQGVFIGCHPGVDAAAREHVKRCVKAFLQTKGIAQ